MDLWYLFTDEQSEGGELDLDGIDDQEIDKVCSLFLFHFTFFISTVKGCMHVVSS